jgi:hypothetical protein
MADILRARAFAIACGYPDADDLDILRDDPAFKLACGRLPQTGDDLASQPTMSRWENAAGSAHADPSVACHGGPVVPELPPSAQAITLDIDDTADTVHRNVSTTLIHSGLEFRLCRMALVHWLCGLAARLPPCHGAGFSRSNRSSCLGSA